jgi:hypothetical protein
MLGGVMFPSHPHCRVCRSMLAVQLQPLYDELKRAVEYYGNYLSTQSGQVQVVMMLISAERM